MKKLVFLFVLSVLSRFAGFSQPIPSEPFVELYNGKVIKAKFVNCNDGLVIADSSRFPDKEVKMYYDGNNLYANFRHLNFLDNTSFYKADKIGKINLFIVTITNTTTKSNATKPSDYRAETISTEYLYYNKGNGKVKKLTYGDLRDDMTDNPESINELKKMRTLALSQSACYLGAIVTGLIALGTQKDGNPDNNALIIPATTAAIVFVVGSFFIPVKKDVRIKKAIDLYNK